MTITEQESAFERELHSLCIRFLDEWDIPMVSIVALLESEQFVIVSLIAEKVDQEDMDEDMDDDEPTGDWGLNGGDDE